MLILGILKSLEEGKDSVHTIEQFVLKAEIDHLNIRPLVEFCRITRLAPKLHGFSMRYNQQDLLEQNESKPADNKTSFKQFLNNIAKKKNEEVIEEKKMEVKQQSEVSFPIKHAVYSMAKVFLKLDFWVIWYICYVVNLKYLI